jgi:condensin complex subunit 2
MPDITGTAVTPGKRVMPLLANFEEWMKMATDNKINANNSWNFALIDYFHEMSLLKEGDGVNFQKASCTLDGCVKIYTSRVDSVATDTGKLLSGLAENAGKKRRGGDAEEGEEGEDEEGEEGEDGQKKRKKRAARSAEATLATSFAQLQNKKMELEFSVDPLFKKASADFDEGGAKGLLLNHLAIDGKGRIVFDSSDDANDATAEETRATPAPEGREETPEVQASDDIDIDISGLASKYFPDLSRLDEQDVCPSMKTFDLGDVNGSMDLPFLKAPEVDDSKDNEEEEGNKSGVFLDDDNPMGFDDDDDVNMGGFDLPPETGFGEGGEVWARKSFAIHRLVCTPWAWKVRRKPEKVPMEPWVPMRSTASAWYMAAIKSRKTYSVTSTKLSRRAGQVLSIGASHVSNILGKQSQQRSGKKRSPSKWTSPLPCRNRLPTCCTLQLLPPQPFHYPGHSGSLNPETCYPTTSISIRGNC